MARSWRLLRWGVNLLVTVAFIGSLFTAGRTYFFCRMIGDVQAHCCCHGSASDDGGRNAWLEEDSDCCQLRTHAAPGDAAPAASDLLVVASFVAPLGAPVALVPRVSARTGRAAFPDWTGPPLDQRRALISVRLL